MGNRRAAKLMDFDAEAPRDLFKGFQTGIVFDGGGGGS